MAGASVVMGFYMGYGLETIYNGLYKKIIRRYFSCFSGE